MADESLAFFVEDEFEAHAFGVIHAADVSSGCFLELHVVGFVGLGLAGHGGILSRD